MNLRPRSDVHANPINAGSLAMSGNQLLLKTQPDVFIVYNFAITVIFEYVIFLILIYGYNYYRGCLLYIFDVIFTVKWVYSNISTIMCVLLHTCWYVLTYVDTYLMKLVISYSLKYQYLLTNLVAYETVEYLHNVHRKPAWPSQNLTLRTYNGFDLGTSSCYLTC